MKRLAILLAATVLGSGCIVSNPCESTISVGWPSFTLADGSSTASCSVAGVASVDVYMNGQPVGSFDCAPGGVTVTQVKVGTYVLTVEGIDSTGRIVLRDETTVAAGTCQDYSTSVNPSEGYVSLAYAFSPTNQCAGTQQNPSYLWFSVYDNIVGGVTVRIDQNSSVADQTIYACPSTILFPLPKGSYTLQWMEEAVRTAPSTWAITGASCVSADFSVAPGPPGQVPVVMTDATVACP